MKEKVVNCLVPIALLFITISCVQLCSIAVAEANGPPNAPSIPSGLTSGSSETIYSYNAWATDPDRDQVKYTFDWGDGTESTTSLVSSGSSAIASHKWTIAPGSTKAFSVRAKAADESGTESSWSSPLSVTITDPLSVTITVTGTDPNPAPLNNPPATPSVPSGSTSGSSGTYYSYSTKATDPDMGDKVEYTFDWGDGITSTTSLVASGTAASASHKWTVASGSTKTFSVRAKAADESGAVSSWSSSLSVTITGPAPTPTPENNPPAAPSVPSGSTSGSSGTYYSYSTKATDPDMGDKVEYTFDWGDGTSSTTSLVASGTSASASHKWTVASGSTKTFSVRAKAADESGAVSSWSSSLSVTITGPAPTPTPENNPPAAPSVPSGSTSGSSGTYYSYSTKATDPDMGDKVEYTFDWGDGTSSTTSLVASGTSASASHKWTVASGSTKTFSVRAKAADESGAVSSWSSTLSVTITGPAPAPTPENNPPAAPSVPSGSTSGSSGTYYSYSTKATDPDMGDKVEYTFDWGDGTSSTTSLVASGTSASASHKWTVASGSTKTFSVRAKAADESGAVSSWSSTLSVTITGPADANSPPTVPTISGPTSGYSGTSYWYSAKATDPEGNKILYTFDWGDGTTSTTSMIDSGTSISISHKWTTAKTFSVRVKAADERGKESGWSTPLSVTTTSLAGGNNPPATPSIPSGDMAGDTGMTYSYSTKAIDPDGDQVKYTFDWGDGTTSTTSQVSSGTSVSASHSWTVAPGTTKTFSVRAKATDVSGTESSWSNALPVLIVAEKENQPPAIPSKPVGPTSGFTGETYSYSTSSTDPDGEQLSYLFDWGDGSTRTGYFNSGQVATASHSWNKVPAGKTWTYNVRVLCSDTRLLSCRDPYWSEPLVVTITGPAIAAQAMQPQTEENESFDTQTEEVVLGSFSNDFDYSSIDAQTEENESIDAQTEENESIDAQTEENESIDAQNEEAEYIDAQNEEDCNFAVDDVYHMAATDNVIKISAPGVLENDQYGNDKSLSVMSYSQPAHAADFAMNSDGFFTYTRSQDYCGEDSFTYKTTDGDCESNEATVTIFIDCGLQNEEKENLS